MYAEHSHQRKMCRQRMLAVLHNGAVSVIINRSSFSERLFRPIDQSRKPSRYCWPTPKYRNLCVPHAFLESKKAWETAPRKSTSRTLKEIRQHYPSLK